MEPEVPKTTMEIEAGGAPGEPPRPPLHYKLETESIAQELVTFLTSIRQELPKLQFWPYPQRLRAQIQSRGSTTLPILQYIAQLPREDVRQNNAMMRLIDEGVNAILEKYNVPRFSSREFTAGLNVLIGAQVVRRGRIATRTWLQDLWSNKFDDNLFNAIVARYVNDSISSGLLLVMDRNELYELEQLTRGAEWDIQLIQAIRYVRSLPPRAVQELTP